MGQIIREFQGIGSRLVEANQTYEGLVDNIEILISNTFKKGKAVLRQPNPAIRALDLVFPHQLFPKLAAYNPNDRMAVFGDLRAMTNQDPLGRPSGTVRFVMVKEILDS